jgi:hypothetical protein
MKPSAAEIALEPADVPVPAELEAGLAERTDERESAARVQLERAVVGQRDPGERAMHTLFGSQDVEERAVQLPADAAADGIRRQVDRGLDGAVVRGLRPEPTARCVAHDGALDFGHQEPMRPRSREPLEPRPARVHGEGLRVERDRRRADVVVVDLDERRQVSLLARTNTCRDARKPI